MRYRVYMLEMNSFTVRVRAKQSCVGYMLKFIMCAIWVSMSCHLQPCVQSTQMASWLERTERVSWFYINLLAPEFYINSNKSPT